MPVPSVSTDPPLIGPSRLELPCIGGSKGAHISWADMTPTPHSGSPLGFALAAAASASLGLLSWGSTPKWSNVVRPFQVGDGNSRGGIDHNGDGFIETCTGSETYDTTCKLPLERVASAVASFGLRSWRASFGLRSWRATRSSIQVDYHRHDLQDSADYTIQQASVMLLPSVGSLLHNTGSCKPCAWFCKPQSCNYGAECKHCHLCPPGEVKRRKAAKIRRFQQEHPQEDAQANIPIDALYQATYVNTQEAFGVIGERETNHGNFCEVAGELADVNPSANAALESEGSRMHGSGDCRPCSWVWKSEGCRFGVSCRHCHLCPEGEQKRRKKDRAAAFRVAGRSKNCDKQFELHAAS